MHFIVITCVIVYLILIGWVVYEWVNAPMIDEDIEELE